MKKRARNYLRLFIVECPGPIEAIEGVSESTAVASVARLTGHAVHSTQVYSLRGLEEACSYVASIEQIEDADLSRPLCLHISAHGADDGLLFGGDSVGWSRLLEVIKPVLTRDYLGTRILILSSCEADQQELTDHIRSAIKRKKRLVPPRFSFCATGKVSWPTAAVGWALLYHLIPSVDLNDKEQVKEMLARIKAVEAATFTYFRWDEKAASYKRYRVST